MAELSDNARMLKNRSARLARLTDLRAPWCVLEREFWLVTKSFVAVRQEHHDSDMELYEQELAIAAENNLKRKHYENGKVDLWEKIPQEQRDAMVKREVDQMVLDFGEEKEDAAVSKV